jgi:hypothetical protein
VHGAAKGTEGGDQGNTLKGGKKRNLEPQSGRFNAFRAKAWQSVYHTLVRTTKKVMGLYVLKDRYMFRWAAHGHTSMELCWCRRARKLVPLRPAHHTDLSYAQIL